MAFARSLTRSQFVRGSGAVALGAALAAATLSSSAFAAEAKSPSGSAQPSGSGQPSAGGPDQQQEETPRVFQHDEPGSTIEGAALYQVSEENGLEYNVTRAAPLATDVIVSDASGNGIDSLDALLDAMGEADAPAAVLSTDPGERAIGSFVRADVTLDDDGNVSAIAVASVSARPVVGISWKRDEVRDDYQGFAEAFERNGAIAVFMPQVTSNDEAAKALSAVDGLFETGGEDWNPSLYGQEQTPHGSSHWNDARDTSDIAYMQTAIETDLPLLCVCRGMQGLNVALGGALIQDIPSYLAQKVIDGEIDQSRVTGVLSGTLPGGDEPAQDTGYQKYDEATGEYTATYDKDTGKYLEGSGCEEGHLRVQVDGIVHSGGDGYHELAEGTDGIGISPDSKWLYAIAGAESIDLVATAHHQAVDPDQLGDGLTIVASSSDGIVEAMEYQASSFALALQWHPERDALQDARGVDVDNDLCNAFLGALVEHAAEHAGAQA